MNNQIFIVKSTFFLSVKNKFIISGRMKFAKGEVKVGDSISTGVGDFHKVIDSVEVIDIGDEGYIGLVFNHILIDEVYLLNSLQEEDILLIISS